MWSESKLISTLTFLDFEASEGTGYFLGKSGKTLSIVDDIDKKNTLSSTQCTIIPLEASTTKLMSFYPNHHPVVIAYGDSDVFYIEPSEYPTNVYKLSVDGTTGLIPSGAKITSVYSFPVCDEERICIIDDRGNIYVVRYDSEASRLRVEKRG